MDSDQIMTESVPSDVVELTSINFFAEEIGSDDSDQCFIISMEEYPSGPSLNDIQVILSKYKASNNINTITDDDINTISESLSLICGCGIEQLSLNCHTLLSDYIRHVLLTTTRRPLNTKSTPFQTHMKRMLRSSGKTTTQTQTMKQSMKRTISSSRHSASTSATSLFQSTGRKTLQVKNSNQYSLIKLLEAVNKQLSPVDQIQYLKSILISLNEALTHESAKPSTSTTVSKPTPIPAPSTLTAINAIINTICESTSFEIPKSESSSLSLIVSPIVCKLLRVPWRSVQQQHGRSTVAVSAPTGSWHRMIASLSLTRLLCSSEALQLMTECRRRWTHSSPAHTGIRALCTSVMLRSLPHGIESVEDLAIGGDSLIPFVLRSSSLAERVARHILIASSHVLNDTDSQLPPHMYLLAAALSVIPQTSLMAPINTTVIALSTLALINTHADVDEHCIYQRLLLAWPDIHLSPSALRLMAKTRYSRSIPPQWICHPQLVRAVTPSRAANAARHLLSPYLNPATDDAGREHALKAALPHLLVLGAFGRFKLDAMSEEALSRGAMNHSPGDRFGGVVTPHQVFCHISNPSFYEHGLPDTLLSVIPPLPTVPRELFEGDPRSEHHSSSASTSWLQRAGLPLQVVLRRVPFPGRLREWVHSEDGVDWRMVLSALHSCYSKR
eukprot:gnl/Dysnectes_brevis/5707_a8370_558.p1 GENE.gnl/Dysnectes_brevis/5707_a8370_558~~gnl/Dysnectes_brevis/5707_a8370_558.p1  ORF type:complete len:672 (+),score=73.38 gnl/Dysnectes_brevis/5707_a8370_558:62-2077(+)